MPTVGCHTDDDGVAGRTGSTERSAPRPLLWRLTWSTLVLCASVVLLVGLGFLWFIRQVPAVEVTLTRDAEGFCSPKGRWGHCMCFIGVTGGRRPGLCCLQSWGPNMPGGPIGLGDHPSCAFWVDAEVADRMLSQGDSWALSAFEGFPARRLQWSHS